MPREFIFWVFIGLLLIPAASAQYTIGNHEYTIATIQTEVQDIDAATYDGVEIFNETFSDQQFNDYITVGSGLIFHVSQTGLFQAAMDGDWRFHLAVDGIVQTDCYTNIRTINPGGFLQGDLPVYAYHRLSCVWDDPNPGDTTPTNHTISMLAEVVEGTPDDIRQLITDVEIRRSEAYMIPQDANEITEAIALFAPLIAFLAVAAWAEKTGIVVVYGLSAVLGIIAVVNLPEELNAVRLALVAVTLFLILRGFNAYNELNGDEDE